MAGRTAIVVAVVSACLLCSAARGQSPPVAPPGGVRESFQFPALPTPNATLPPTRPPSVGPTGNETFLSDGAAVLLPSANKQFVRFAPRYGSLGAIDWTPDGTGGQQLIYTGGIIVTVTYSVAGRNGTEMVQYEFASDNLVMWVRGMNGVDPTGGVTVDAAAPEDRKAKVELYLAGNVVIKTVDTTPGPNGAPTAVTRVIRADQIYYDVERNRAICLEADLEIKSDTLPDPAHVYGKEVWRLGKQEWRAIKAGAHASKLPSDPAVRLLTSEASYVENPIRARNVFGIPYRNPFNPADDDKPSYERTLTTNNTRVTIAGVPIFYTPRMKTDLAEPFGPLTGVGFGNDQMFGAQIYSSWDIYKLLALRAPAGHSWRLHADYLGDRGPAFGTDYAAAGANTFGFGGPYFSLLRLYGLNDAGTDLIGFRGPEPTNPRFRYRVQARHQQELYSEREPDTFFQTGLTVQFQGQYAQQSDKNFLEQYYALEFANGVNQETFANIAATDGIGYAAVLAQTGQNRTWMTETKWLPRIDGAVVGKSFFDFLSYDVRANAGYAELKPATTPALPFAPTDRKTETGRADLMQELSAPFDLGPVKLNPYGLLDLTAYSNDLTGESRGRVYGGGGLRSAVTFSKIYTDASSELFNVKGLNHKVTWHGDYFYGRSSVRYTDLPQLDRLSDDITDFTQRSFRPQSVALVPGPAGPALVSSPLFDPQRYAIRRGVSNNVEARDDLQVFRLGSDHRLQTKRGFTGLEHTVDWLTVNTSVSYFPDAERDNFGKNTAFLEYQALWNIGDRTALQSAGWFDPFDPGVRYFNVGTYLTRPDNTNFYVGYRQIDPINSKAVMANVFYPLSQKYAFNAFTSYDFGTQQSIANVFSLVRTGKDLTVSLGFTYNAIVNNFGVQFSVVPNAAAGSSFGRLGSPQLGGR